MNQFETRIINHRVIDEAVYLTSPGLHIQRHILWPYVPVNSLIIDIID